MYEQKIIKTESDRLATEKENLHLMDLITKIRGEMIENNEENLEESAKFVRMQKIYAISIFRNPKLSKTRKLIITKIAYV